MRAEPEVARVASASGRERAGSLAPGSIPRATNLGRTMEKIEGTSVIAANQCVSINSPSSSAISAENRRLDIQYQGRIAGFGIKSTVYADHVDVSTTGTAADYDNALSVTEKEFSVPAFGSIPARNWYGTAQAPLLPYRLASFVEAILGLSNYPPFSSSMEHVNTSYLPPQGTSALAPGDGAYCVALTGLSNACNLPSNFASNYDLNGLYNKGADGQGRTLAIVTLAAVHPSAPAYLPTSLT